MARFMPKIHPTAVVDPKARIAPDVEIGPYTVIDGPVSVGEGTWIGSHVCLTGDVSLGRRCRVFPFAVIGTPPQDRTFAGGESRVVIGDDNVFREHVTIHGGTPKGGGVTTLGNRNWFLVDSHVAHDCTVGDDNTFANWSALAGHVKMGSNVMLSAYVAVHQFCRVGRLVMIGGITGVSLDIPPFTLVQGNRARLLGLNRVGLKRAGITGPRLKALQEAYQILFRGKGALSARIAAARKIDEPLAREMTDFLEGSKRGVCTHEAAETPEDVDASVSRAEAISAATGVAEK